MSESQNNEETLISSHVLDETPISGTGPAAVRFRSEMLGGPADGVGCDARRHDLCR